MSTPSHYALRGGVFLVLALLLSACRMPVTISGQGYVYGEGANQLYADGYVFDINEDFAETFWPVPVPGHSFRRWTTICKNSDAACELVLDEELWSRDDSVPLEASFRPNYNGPLEIVYFEAYWEPALTTISVPLSSIDVRGVHPGQDPRYFLASTDLRSVIPASTVGTELRFPLPNDNYAPEEYWLFASAVDSDGTLASASLSFGLAERVAGSDLQVYNPDSPWARVLRRCATANTPFDICRLGKLPFLGQSTPDPAVDDILARTLVSHHWMGERFGEILRELPADMLKLFRGTTAVVIGANIRPAFHSLVTGAIYLDPQDLWLSPAERQSIDWEPDYRADFGGSLAFIPTQLYVAGNAPAWYPSYLYEEGESRQLQEIVMPMANLLAHELAHANDAMPPALLSATSPVETPLDAALRLELQSPSLLLLGTYPLTSSFLYQVAEVLFYGAEATPSILQLSARALGLEFAQDQANDLYAYASPYEDTAMLVEEVLTNYYFGLDRVVAFLDTPQVEPRDCTDYKLQWGETNRVTSPVIRERARLVLSGILGEDDVSRYLDAIAPAQFLQQGLSLCENLDLLAGGQPRIPGRFIPPPEAARQRALSAHTHHQMRKTMAKVARRHPGQRR